MDAKGCYSLKKYGTQNNAHSASGCFGFRTLPFKGGEGLLLLGKVRNLKQPTYCDVGCFGLCTLLFKGGEGLLLLEKVWNPKQPAYCDVVCLGSVLYLSNEAKGCYSLKKVLLKKKTRKTKQKNKKTNKCWDARVGQNQVDPLFGICSAT